MKKYSWNKLWMAIKTHRTFEKKIKPSPTTVIGLFGATKYRYFYRYYIGISIWHQILTYSIIHWKLPCLFIIAFSLTSLGSRHSGGLEALYNIGLYVMSFVFKLMSSNYAQKWWTAIYYNCKYKYFQAFFSLDCLV